MNPVDNPEAYETIVLAGLESPGIATVTAPTLETGWDQQQGKDPAKPGESVQNGTKGLEIQVELKLWKDPSLGIDHFAEWDTFRDQILKLPTKKGDPKALDVYHPLLEGMDISSVVVKSFSNPQPDGTGLGVAKLVLLQYLPSKPKGSGGKPKGSKGNQKGDPPDPNADVKQALEDEVDTYNSPAEPLW